MMFFSIHKQGLTGSKTTPESTCLIFMREGKELSIIPALAWGGVCVCGGGGGGGGGGGWQCK